MGKEDIGRIRSVSPDSLIIATHMETINHCILSRKELNDYVKKINIQMLKSHWMEKQSNYKYLFFNYIK